MDRRHLDKRHCLYGDLRCMNYKKICKTLYNLNGASRKMTARCVLSTFDIELDEEKCNFIFMWSVNYTMTSTFALLTPVNVTITKLAIYPCN